jgi:hypothetical protein
MATERDRQTERNSEIEGKVGKREYLRMGGEELCLSGGSSTVNTFVYHYMGQICTVVGVYELP